MTSLDLTPRELERCMGHKIAPADAAAHTCRQEGCPRSDPRLPMIADCDRCGRPGFTECLRFHAGMHSQRYPVTADFLTFAAELLERQGAEIQSFRRRLAVHEERLPRVSEAAGAEARRITRPSRGVGEPSADWP